MARFLCSVLLLLTFACERRASPTSAPAEAAAAARPPLHELIVGKWNLDSVRDAKVNYDQEKLATMSWEFTTDTMVTYIDHRQTHEEHYRLVKEEGNVVTFVREPNVEGRLEFADDDTILWTNPTLGVVVMKRAFARGR